MEDLKMKELKNTNDMREVAKWLQENWDKNYGYPEACDAYEYGENDWRYKEAFSQIKSDYEQVIGEYKEQGYLK